MSFSYFIKRLLLVVPTLIGITFVAFVIIQFVPGGPLEKITYQYLSQSGSTGGASSLTEDDLLALKKYFGFDKPWWKRYFIWLAKVSHFDFGISFRYFMPAWDIIKSKLKVSLWYGLWLYFLLYVLAIPLGIVKAIKHKMSIDNYTSWVLFALYAIPPFAIGIILLLVFSVYLGWFPLGGFVSDNFEVLSFWGKFKDLIWHSVLPLVSYLVGSIAPLTLLVKNSVLVNLTEDYMRFALAKGLSFRQAVFRHAFRNSLIPLATTIGSILGVFFAGSFIIETVFNIDGMGLLGYTSITERDYPVVLAILLLSSFLKLVGNIVSDFTVSIVDPRVRF